jgi:predicted anti-sigma-YlaC factor YlaD
MRSVRANPSEVRGSRVAGLALVAALALTGCSIRSLAINALANSLAESGDVFASDGDPELIRDATPFALKTMETLLAEKPDHPGLLLSACRGFTQYAYAFVQLDAERLEGTDFAAAEAERARALALDLRGRNYCLRSLEHRFPGVRQALEMRPEQALAAAAVDDVPLLYWTGAAWGSAISLGLDRPDLTVDLPAVRALVKRAAALDPTYGQGAVEEALMVLASLPKAMGGSPDEALHHFDRAVELSGGKSASPYVALASGLMVRQQNRERFESLLHQALAIDPDAEPAERLANVIAQRRARWLLGREDELFL